MRHVPGDLLRRRENDPNMLVRHRTRPSVGCTQGLLRKSAIVASGQAAGYALALVASPVLSRLYSPLDFGQMAIFVTLMSILGTFATLRFDNAIPLPSDTGQANALAALARRSIAFISSLLLVVAFVFGDDVNRHVFGSRDTPFSYLLVAAVVVYASCEIHNAWLVRRSQFAVLSRMRMVYAIACLSAQLSVPLAWKLGPLGLLMGPIVGYSIESLALQFSERRHSAAASDNEPRNLYQVARQYRSYPLYDVWASLLRILALNGQSLAIAWIYSPVAAGSLALAHRLLATPVSMLGFSISRVFYSEAAALARENPAELPSLFRHVLGRLTLLAAPPLAIVCVLAPSTFGFVFGAQWRTAGVYCSILCPLILLRVIAVALGPTLDVVNRQGLRLVRELVCVVLIALGAVAARWLGWSELAAVVITTMLGCVGYAVSIALTWRAVLAHCRAGDAAISRIQQAAAA